MAMIVKKNQRALSIPLNDAAFGVAESRPAIQHGPYVFYSPMTGDRFRVSRVHWTQPQSVPGSVK